MSDATGQSQSQHQEQFVTINVRSSGDPELERRILNGRHGVGRQLGALSAVVEVLLAAHEKAPPPAEAEASIAKFRQAQSEIEEEKEKRLREPERLLAKVQRAERDGADEARKAIAALRDWLATCEAALPGRPGAPE